MSETYQGTRNKSNQKFEVVENGKLLVEMPLPMVEVWEELQAQVEQLNGARRPADYQHDSGRGSDEMRHLLAK